jgi:endo-1,4-beta-xylanase
MVSFKSLFLAATAVVEALAAPTGEVAVRSEGSVSLSKRTSSSTGTSGGYYYSFWTDTPSSVTYTNGAGGEYTVSWNGNGNFVGGKGWQTGSARYVLGLTFQDAKSIL